MSELRHNTNGSVTAALLYSYDADGALVSVNYNGTEYYYLRNGQNNVVGLVDGSGNTVVAYSYDAWGKLPSTTGSLASTLGVDNPIRYRGYYYDTETGLYYLQSHYYDPDTGRFINLDDVVILAVNSGNLVQHNLFAYCLNNPVINSDPSGYVVSPANIIGGIIGAIVGAVGGYFLSRWLADKLKLSGWKRTVFIAGLTAVITAAAAVIGYFIGPYVENVGRSMVKAIRTLAGTTSCFVAGTIVLTNEGEVPIEQIRAGDKVYSENPETGEVCIKSVVRTFVREIFDVIRIKVNDEIITTTPEHPFYTTNLGWVEAKKLRSGDMLTSQDGGKAIVDEVVFEHLETPVLVYNFEVEGFHTYFVGSTHVLVHNTCIKEFLRSPKSFKEVAKLLEEYGFKKIRQTGSHVMFNDPISGITIPVPNHGSKEIAVGTLRSILRSAGLLD